MLLLFATWSASRAGADPGDWSEGADGNGGATRDDYNSAARLAWKNRLGDWKDAKDVAQGDTPYAVAPVGPKQKGSFVEWDVTPLVKAWLAGTVPAQGFFLRCVEGKGDFQFASRENQDAERRPQLVLHFGEKPVVLAPQADTYLEASTYRGFGHLETLRISQRPNPGLLRFDLAAANGKSMPDRAVLRLFNTAQTSGANGTIGVFRCAQGHASPQDEVQLGLAAAHPGNRGLAKDPDVVLFADFEGDDWGDAWTQVAPKEAVDTVAADEARKFVPLSGRALRSKLAEGSSTALNTLFKFAKETGSEPEEMFFRYYLRLGDDWNQTLQGGKLPGFSGTYGRAGWGGRKSNGSNGWSARGSFGLTIPADNPLAGLAPIGNYCYHAEMPGFYGDVWGWQRDYRGYLEKNRWYCLEQCVKLNRPDANDGVLRAWIDGRLAFEKTDLRYRTVDALKIEQVWLNIYHGGTQPSPRDQHAYLDEIVIARKYVGPRK
jgi:hypothetical protein